MGIWGQRGDTAAWAELRAQWAALLPMPCWRCGQRIDPDPPGTPPARSGWHVGHLVDRALGGSDDRTAPEHAACSRHAGGVLGGRIFAARQAARRAGQAVPPSANTDRARAVRARRARRAAPSRDWLQDEGPRR